MRDKILKQLRKLTEHKYVDLTNRGNSSIFLAIKMAEQFNPKRFCLIPDQGGWLTYKQFARELNLEVRELKTDYGVIDLKDLENKLKNASCLIYSQPVGYYADQNVKQIYKLCEKHDCLVILDITGSIGTSLFKGKYADIMVGSFGLWKPIDLSYGGFISFKKQNHFIVYKEEDKEKYFFREKYEKRLMKKMDDVKKRHKLFNKHNKKVKSDLKRLGIIHKNKKGINVIVKFINDEEKNKIIEYCKKNNYPFTICPRYIRVEEQAVSIEIKRLQ